MCGVCGMVMEVVLRSPDHFSSIHSCSDDERIPQLDKTLARTVFFLLQNYEKRTEHNMSQLFQC